MSQELIDAVDNLTAQTTTLLGEYADAKTTIDGKVSQASTSATNATTKAGEASTSEVNAAASATTATNEKLAAQGEANRAKTEADRAELVAGLATVADAVNVALNDRKLTMRSGADMYAMLAQNNERFAASGMVHAGRSQNANVTTVPINQGLWAKTTVANQLRMGFNPAWGAEYGDSKTRYPVVNIAGFTTKLIKLNDYNPDCTVIKFDEAEKGTRTYCTETGESIDYRTYADPRYDNTVAQDDNEAVARAFGGAIANNDLRLGNAYWDSLTGSTVSVVDGVATLTTSPISNGLVKITGTFINGHTYHVKFYATDLNATTATFRIGSVYNPDETIALNKGVGWYEAEIVAQADATYVAVHAETSDRHIAIRDLSIRSLTEEVVLNRTDLAGLEGFLQRVTPERPRVFPFGLVQSMATSMSGVATSDSPYPASYHAVFDDDTTSGKKSVDWFAASVLEQDAMANDPDNNIWNLGLDEAGEPIIIQFCVRQRSIMGVNGDWRRIDSFSGALQVSDATKSRLGIQGTRDTPYGWVSSGSNNHYYGESGAEDRYKGVFSAYKPSEVTAAYDGHCYFLPICTVSRLNQGASHPLNPQGAGTFIRDDGSATLDWYADNKLNEPLTAKDCFIFPTDAYPFTTGYVWPDSGSIGGVASGHPQGRFHDAIYPSGQANGVRDLRPKYGAWDASSIEQASEVRSLVESGEYRGLEKLKFTYWHPDELTITGAANWYTSHDGEFTFAVQENVSENVDLFFEQEAESWLLSGDNGESMVVPRSGKTPMDRVYFPHVDGQIHAYGTTGINIQAELRAKFPIGTKLRIGATYPTNLSVSGNFLQTDVIGSPESILQCDVLKEGWVGSWCPTIPDGSTQEYIMQRKARSWDTVRYRYTSGTWATESGVTYWDSVKNSVTSGWWGLGSVGIVNYTAAAKVTKPSTNKPVLHGRAGLGDVSASSENRIDFMCLLVESFIGKVCTAPAGWGSHIRSVPFYNGVINQDGMLNGTGVADRNMHGPLLVLTGDVSYNAAKWLTYQTKTNAQVSLSFVYNELKFNGTDWGDSSALTIQNDGTYTNDNGDELLCGTAELAIPYGYIKNEI